MTTDRPAGDWVPAACTLPTAEQPLRTAEFDDLFARDTLAVRHESAERIRLQLRPDPQVAARAADLAARETSCCSFFAFGLAIADGEISLIVEVGEPHTQVLAALAARAAARAGSPS